MSCTLPKEIKLTYTYTDRASSVSLILANKNPGTVFYNTAKTVFSITHNNLVKTKCIIPLSKHEPRYHILQYCQNCSIAHETLQKTKCIKQTRAQGPYAWVPGSRATSKVTATSGGRLTNRYAWVPGRPTRRACLGVNLPLRVPPCKHYPEEVTELKMAALILLRYRQRRRLRRNRIFRDRTNTLHKFNDLELFWQFRFRRADILQMTNELKEELEHLNRRGALSPVFTGRRTALNPCQQ